MIPKKSFLKRAKKMAKPALTMTALLLLPTYALANPIVEGVDWLVGLLTNGLSRSLAIIAIVVMGFLAWAGRLDGGLVGKWIAGMIFVFGGATLVDLFSTAVSGA